jgi:HNH endonuclease
MPRKAISKKRRFSIFARDQFTCRYCGEQPPQVKLVVDHLKPVAEGGGDEEENLITACEGCNGGKGKSLIENAGPTDTDSARRAQEMIEQSRLADLAEEAANARARLQQTMVNQWCVAFGQDQCKIYIAQILCVLADEFGPERIFMWLDLTAAKGLRHSDAIKYIRGIARTTRERENA